MTNQELRIKVAEARGWIDIKRRNVNKHACPLRGMNIEPQYKTIPNYTTSMDKFVRTLDFDHPPIGR